VEFEIVGPVRNIETIAAGRAIREVARLRRQYGKGRWRKRKGIATVRSETGPFARRRFTGTKLTASDDGT
jgi:hypothetical protein